MSIDDTDSSPYARHHTLGSQVHQAAPGRHTHNGDDSILIGSGLGLTITGSRTDGTAVASIIQMLAKVIEFTDATGP